LEGFNINEAGFVSCGMFIVCFATALLVWKLGRIEERWGTRLKPGDAREPNSA
jgi:nickel/cobalt transporter (NiCoT) family protein